MTTYLLVRHAHSRWTPDEMRPLSAQGLDAAQQVVRTLIQFPIEAIYASPYTRALQTIEPYAAETGLPICIEDDLRERQLGGRPADDFEAAIEAVWRNPSFAHPGGESNRTAQQRGVAVLEALHLRHPIGHVAVATHGNLMALILQHYDPSLGYDFWRQLRMPDVHRLQMARDGSVAIERIVENGGASPPAALSLYSK